MALLTQDQIAQQLVAQLRTLDPSVSAEVGTPERKLLDTFAQALVEAQVNANLVSGALDFDTKVGTDLDAYIGTFGFGRQQGGFATGFVTFSRPTASAYNITIPGGTQIVGIEADVNGNSFTVTFQTTTAVTLTTGQTSVAAPIQSLLAGAQGNVAPNTITQFGNLGAPPLGITTVTNSIPTTNGTDVETDPELKVRFRNTVFRNMAGTQDQYMALAVATQFSTKANVIGPVSRYQEYMQIPSADDSAGGNGIADSWTTSQSDNQYAQYVYIDLPNFASNGQTGTATVFYRQDTDFTLNVPSINAGDTFRESETLNPLTPNATFFNVYTGADDTVQLPRAEDVVLLEYSYLSAESRNSIDRNITNCVDVYVNGQNPTITDAIVPPPPGGLNLFSNSGTDKFYYQHFRRIGQPDVTPTVGHIFTGLFWQPVIAVPDLIVAGANTYFSGIHYWGVTDLTLLANTARARNGLEWIQTLNGAALGDPGITIWTSGQDWNIGNIVWYNNSFYTALNNLVNDTVAPPSDVVNWSNTGSPFTGTPITSPGTTAITVSGYTYDKNIADLQVALDGAKQVTTDILAHAATQRYFKLDVTVVYQPGAGIANTNLAIQTAVANFFAGQYFGSVIQLSDLLALIRTTRGVQNVRWSRDDDVSLHRITECDVNGNPRLSGTVFYDADFFLRDSELPNLPAATLATDTLAGLIIRPRAQNTFNFPTI